MSSGAFRHEAQLSPFVLSRGWWLSYRKSVKIYQPRLLDLSDDLIHGLVEKVTLLSFYIIHHFSNVSMNA